MNEEERDDVERQRPIPVPSLAGITRTPPFPLCHHSLHAHHFPSGPWVCVIKMGEQGTPPSGGESSGPFSKLNGSPAVVCQTILAFVHYEASQKISRSCHGLPHSFLSLSRSGLVERPRPSMWKPSPWLLGRMGRWLWPTHTPLPPLSVLQRKSICQSL